MKLRLTTLMIQPDMWNAFKAIADRRGTTASSLLRMHIRDTVLKERRRRLADRASLASVNAPAAPARAMAVADEE